MLPCTSLWSRSAHHHLSTCRALGTRCGATSEKAVGSCAFCFLGFGGKQRSRVCAFLVCLLCAFHGRQAMGGAKYTPSRPRCTHCTPSRCRAVWWVRTGLLMNTRCEGRGSRCEVLDASRISPGVKPAIPVNAILTDLLLCASHSHSHSLFTFTPSHGQHRSHRFPLSARPLTCLSHRAVPRRHCFPCGRVCSPRPSSE